MSDDQPVEHDLIRSFVGAEIETVETRIQETSNGDKHVVIVGRLAVDDGEDEDVGDLVEAVAFGLIYTLALCSFTDAVPAGNSGEYGFKPDDQLTAADMLRHLRFRRGELHLYVDYLRGRMLKTSVVVRKDGTFELETVNRGTVAVKWIERLQGKGDEPAKAPSAPPAPPRMLN